MGSEWMLNATHAIQSHSSVDINSGRGTQEQTIQQRCIQSKYAFSKMATGINWHKTVCGVETWQTAGSDSRPAGVTQNGSHSSTTQWNFYEDSSVSVRFCQTWDVTFLGSYDVQKSMFRMHLNMQHLVCMRANMSVHINKCRSCWLY